MAERADRDEQGEVLAVADVNGGPPPAQLGIVHARQVVEDERGRVNHFHSAARIDGGFGVAAQILRRDDGHQWPQAFPRRQHAVVHGPSEGRLSRQHIGRQFAESAIDPPAVKVDAGVRIRRHRQGFASVILIRKYSCVKTDT